MILKIKGKYFVDNDNIFKHFCHMKKMNKELTLQAREKSNYFIQYFLGKIPLNLKPVNF